MFWFFWPEADSPSNDLGGVQPLFGQALVKAPSPTGNTRTQDSPDESYEAVTDVTLAHVHITGADQSSSPLFSSEHT